MRSLALLAAFASVLGASVALAHGDQPHPECKKGWIMTEDHKCVKKN